MKQSSKRLMSLIFAVILLFGAFFVYFNLIQPSYERVQKARAEVYSREELITNQRVIVDQVKKALASFESKEEIQATVSSAIPPTPGQSQIVNQINSLASTNRLAVQVLTAATPTVQTIKESEIKEGSEKFKVQPLGIMSLQIKLAGSYADLKSFLAALENNIRITDIKNLAIEPLGKSNQDYYLFSLTVVTYYQNQ